MKQKLFSWTDDFVIKDEAENDVFVVDGEGFTLSKKFVFQDLAGKKLASIQQELPGGATYDIYKGEDLWAVVHKKFFTFFNCTFTVQVAGQEDLVAEGEFTDHDYVFKRGSQAIARVSKEWFTWADTYGVEVDEKQDDILILACTVVIDMCCHPDGPSGWSVLLKGLSS
jgi:uncharacterized protein YxjI